MASKKLQSLAEARKANGLSQQQLASIVGAHWITISKLERGKMRITYEWAAKLSEALNIKIEDIFHLNSNYSTDVIPISGYLYEKGHVRDVSLDEGRVAATDTSRILHNDSFYILANTEDFAPIIKETDIIRLTSIPEGLSSTFVGRLCLGVDAEFKYLGVSYFSSDAGKFEIRSLNGNLLTPSPVTLSACVTMIICAWLPFGEVPWREFDSKGGAT